MGNLVSGIGKAGEDMIDLSGNIVGATAETIFHPVVKGTGITKFEVVGMNELNLSGKQLELSGKKLAISGKQLEKIAKQIGIVIGVLLLIMLIIMIVILTVNSESRDALTELLNRTPEEEFQDNLMFPKAQDADETGEFDTLNRECAPGLTKCMKYLNGGNGVTYWCAPHCDNKRLHLTGTPLKEPLDWNVRFV